MALNKNNLKFVHITKTSGTYIEKLGLKQKLKWGINDLRFIGKKKRIPGPSWHDALFMREHYMNNPNITTFTIVRNPYDRLVSECFCKYYSRRCHIKTVDDFNKTIYRYITRPFVYETHFNGHCCPQYYYTHNKDKHQIIDFIIKYEDMNPFNELMKMYDIDINYISNKKTIHKFNVKDISRDNLNLINQIYHYDFKLLGYEKI